MVLNELAVLDLLDGGTATAPMTAPAREIRMALARCARVSRAWYKLAQAHLYRAIVVGNLRQCEAFVRTLEHNPELALIPRNLVLFGGPAVACPSGPDDCFGRHSQFIRVLSLCVHLERIRLTDRWELFYESVIGAISKLRHVSALYFRPHIRQVGLSFEHYSVFSVLERLPSSLEYVHIDSTVLAYLFMFRVPSHIGLVEYKLSSSNLWCDPVFIFEGLDQFLAIGNWAIPGGRIRILYEHDVDSALVGRVVAGFAAQGVELKAVKTT